MCSQGRTSALFHKQNSNHCILLIHEKTPPSEWSNIVERGDMMRIIVVPITYCEVLKFILVISSCSLGCNRVGIPGVRAIADSLYLNKSLKELW